MKPTRPWVKDLEEAPPIPADLSAKVAQARTAAKVGFAALEQRPRPEPVIVDRETPRVVPTFVYEATRRGAK